MGKPFAAANSDSLPLMVIELFKPIMRPCKLDKFRCIRTRRFNSGQVRTVFAEYCSSSDDGHKSSLVHFQLYHLQLNLAKDPEHVNIIYTSLAASWSLKQQRFCSF